MSLLHRRTFIKNSALFSLGFVIIPSLAYCSNKQIRLEEIIGKDESILHEFPAEGDAYLPYYTLSKSNFSHSSLAGNQAFVFCQDGKIIGYVLQMKGSNNDKIIKDEISGKYGVPQKDFENDFGVAYSWRNETRKCSFSMSKNYKNSPNPTFYSEAVLEKAELLF